MTAAYRLKGIGWFGGCVVVTIGFYLVSVQVAAERKKIEQLDLQITSAERDVRALETEFDTRANLAQLERWNGDTLSLVAPVAAQFVSGDAALAQLTARGFGSTRIETASLVVPAYTPTPTIAVAVAQTPTVVQSIEEAPASTVSASPVATASNRAAASKRTPRGAGERAAAVVRTATAAVTRSLKRDVSRTATVTAARAAEPATPIARKAQVAMLDRSLLSDRTLGDLVNGARSESGRRR